jgi:hypothetical protein
MVPCPIPWEPPAVVDLIEDDDDRGDEGPSFRVLSSYFFILYYVKYF